MMLTLDNWRNLFGPSVSAVSGQSTMMSELSYDLFKSGGYSHFEVIDQTIETFYNKTHTANHPWASRTLGNRFPSRELAEAACMTLNLANPG